MKRFAALGIVGVIVAVAIIYMVVHDGGSPVTETPVTTKRDYVGVAGCAQCHQQEAEDWRGSHHDLAMQHATEETVLGDFNDQRLNHYGVESAFTKKQGKHFVRTDGPDGTLQDYEIKYAFGVEPLQQYLVEFDGGRLQALHLAWDSRPEQDGGQRWFHLYPDQRIDHTDELHWTRLAQNWNYMCAECHSTNLKKNFDLVTNQFDTTWSEINVACEACHGPGSAHVAWAEKAPGTSKLEDKGFEIQFDERQGALWQFDGSGTIAVRSTPRTTVKEIETCARCHSRRSLLSEDYQHGKPFLDTHLPALLTEQLYHADGQIDDEVYVYGSFLQSKMFEKGVTCSDCHDPHTLKLRAPENQVCLQCHQASAYDSRAHHFHPEGSDGSLCAECHMPPKNYMVVDPRHDHSFRVPRPDLSERLNTPNACNQCHTDETAAWASGMLDQWYGENRTRDWHYGETLFAAQQGMPGAGRELAALAASPKFPEIVRATAASLLPGFADPLALAVLQPLLGDNSARVREAALVAVDGVDAGRRWGMAGSLLSDPVYAVRIEAARVLSAVDREPLTPEQRALLDRGIAEYVDAQLASAEHPQSHVNLGLLYTRQGKHGDAQLAYEQALRLEPSYDAAFINLSDLFRAQGQEEKVEEVLLKGQRARPDSAAIAHSLGLHYARVRKMPLALDSLQHAARLAPEDIRFSYVYAVALHDSGRLNESLRILRSAHDTQPNNAEVLVALVSYSAEAGKDQAAREYASKLVEIEPRLGTVDDVLQRLAAGN